MLFQKDIFNTDIDVLLNQIEGKVTDEWLAGVTELLQIPEKIRFWRSIIWDVMGESIYQRVQIGDDWGAAKLTLIAVVLALITVGWATAILHRKR